MNNSLYDISEMAIPLDDETVAQPRRWDLNLNPPIHARVRAASSIADVLSGGVACLAHTAGIILGAATARFFEDLNRTNAPTRRKSVDRDNFTSRCATGFR